MARMLVADGDNVLTDEIKRVFSGEGFDVEVAYEAVSASLRIFQKAHDLIVLDLSLLGMDVFTLCHKFRESGGTAALVATSADKSIECEEKILNVGADDFVSKPFQVRELLMRAKAVLRRSPSTMQPAQILRFADIELDITAGTVRKDGEQIHLFPMEFNLLEFLIRHPNQAFSSNALWQRVWKDKNLDSADTVRTHIKTLRRKIDKPGQPSLIKTEYRRGYKLIEPTNG